MFQFLSRIFGTAQSRAVKRYKKKIALINAEYAKLGELSTEALKGKTQEFQKRLAEGETLDMLLPEAFAVVKEACRRLCGTEIQILGCEREWNLIPFDVQLLGGIALHEGNVAEMQTGEGKTLTAVLPLYLNALEGKSVHLATVNDYLAQRDCELNKPIFNYLGVTTGAIISGTPLDDRREIYKRDVIYGTASEFGFDYLRDNSMASSAAEQVQSYHHYVIVDEIDSILIDEARTPLIISGPAPESKQMYAELEKGAANLVKRQRELCNRLAKDAKDSLDKLNVFQDNGEFVLPKGKQELADFREALCEFWVLSKGMPHHRVLKRLREEPSFRDQLDKLESYFHSDQNKQERLKRLSLLYITIEERTSEYELTDKGAALWQELEGGEGEEFVMMDLGEEYRLIDEDASLTESDKLERKLEVRQKDAHRKERAHNLGQLFRAYLLMEKDVDYIVQDGSIVIIDENTGRAQPGRRFSDGLHQAIEAKEGVEIQGETQTYATVTLQNYFRMYNKIAGMSGTAITEANEFKEIYGVDVVEIPTHLPCIRKDAHDAVYMTEREKYHAILAEVKEKHEQGRPILIGTESVEVSEKLSRIFRQNNLPHTVLNAKHHEREAEIIAQAGQKGAITISTNMAGRGTDIKLGEGVKECGGLHVLGTTRHQSRRIDRQLRGRCSRQGDPGTSVFFVSFEDELMRLFASPRLNAMLLKLRPPEGESISSPLLTRSIEVAQKRVEQRNYSFRKHTLEYDDVMNKHRQEIYAFRNEIICTETILNICDSILEEVLAQQAERYLKGSPNGSEWDEQGYREWLMEFFPVRFAEDAFSSMNKPSEIVQKAFERVAKAFRDKLYQEEQKLVLLDRQRVEDMPLIEVEARARGAIAGTIKRLLVHKLDRQWQEHLLTMDHLRTEVSMRTVAQKDPLMEFKHEAFESFSRLNDELYTEMAKDLFAFAVIPGGESFFNELLGRIKMEKNRSLVDDLEGEEVKAPPKIARAEDHTKRNELCPCGSGKKYKKCCGLASLQAQ